MALIAKNVMVDGRRTSMRLERLMWDALDEIARREGMTVNDLVTRVAADEPHNLSSDVRVFVARYYQQAATELGHAAAGHGSGDLIAAVGGEPEDAPVRKRGRGRPARRVELVA